VGRGGKGPNSHEGVDREDNRSPTVARVVRGGTRGPSAMDLLEGPETHAPYPPSFLIKHCKGTFKMCEKFDSNMTFIGIPFFLDPPQLFQCYPNLFNAGYSMNVINALLQDQSSTYLILDSMSTSFQFVSGKTAKPLLAVL
jgi:hypothetical protein